MVCTFFGHRDCPEKMESSLKATIAHLISDRSVNLFYVGNNGAFDRMVLRYLKLFKQIYPHIEYFVVLAYMPGSKSSRSSAFEENTLFPDGLEFAHPKYAIIKRNMWMLDRADLVVTYVKSSFGGAAYFKNVAEKRNKEIISL